MDCAGGRPDRELEFIVLCRILSPQARCLRSEGRQPVANLPPGKSLVLKSSRRSTLSI